MKKFFVLLLVAILSVVEVMAACGPTPTPERVEVTRIIEVTKELVVTPTPLLIDKHEPNDTPDEAIPLALGETITPYILSEGDDDYFTFDIDKLGVIEIELIDPPGPDHDYDIFLLDSKYEEVALSATEADSENVRYGPSEVGTFYVRVSPYTGYSQSEPYSITVTFEPLGVTLLTSGEAIEEDLDEGGEKHYAINVPSGYKRLEVGLQGPEDTEDTEDFNLFIKRDSPPTTEIYDESSEQGGSEEAICIDDPGGIYYITVVSSTGSGSFWLKATAQETTPGATFGEITMSEGVEKLGDNDYEPVNPRTDFPAGTTRVYAIWKYEGMHDGAIWRRMWSRDGDAIYEKTQTWASEWGGSGVRTWSYSRKEGLLSGNYEFRLFICNELVQTAFFTVAEEAKEK